MDVHAGKPLSRNIWGNFNDYSEKIGWTPINRSTAQSLRVGENPLNGKGLPLALFKINWIDEGEEIVYSRLEREWITLEFKNKLKNGGDYNR